MSEEKNIYNQTIQEVEERFKTDVQQGLSQLEAEKRLNQYGRNEIQDAKHTGLVKKFLNQFKDFMIIILIISAIVSGVLNTVNGEGMTDTIIILVVVVVNAIIGVVQEAKSEKSMEALKQMSDHTAKVLRNGKQVVISAKDLVPGDIIFLDTGDFVPADIRIVEAVNLKTQESALTGESVPVEKITVKLEKEKLGVGDRKNMSFSSSLVTYGRGKGIVVATGMNTEVGQIATMINNTVDERTPLQIKLDQLGKILGISALVICAIIFGIGMLYGKQPFEMFMTAVSLAVAAIPEGLVAVSTIVLAIGVQRMAKQRAIIKKLPAVETLGSTSVICTDKTGTLTQNKMTVKKVCWDNKIVDLEKINMTELQNKDLNSFVDLKRLTYCGMFCNDTKIGADNSLIGDPTETALIDMSFGLEFDAAKFEEHPRVNEIPFDSDRKLMTTVNKHKQRWVVYTKGGMDELVSRCNYYVVNNEVKPKDSEFEKQIAIYNYEMAKSALRVLAFAYKDFDHEPTDEEMKNIENDLIFVGMVGMIDPPRIEVKAAVESCKSAGIKTVMITGDHVTTAVAIAKELGILEDDSEAITGAELEEMSDDELFKNITKYSVYARVSPKHKVRVVEAWQKRNDIVAMTGDGVNDAPALKKADIGCAMGITGTEVSKEAADVILTDDNFATIVNSVKEGRRIFDNISKAILFLLSTNMSEIIIMLVVTLMTPLIATQYGIDVNLVQIFTAVQLLWINLVTDSLPALALAYDPADKDVMNRKPNKKKGFFSKRFAWRVLSHGLVIALVVIGAFMLGLNASQNTIDKAMAQYPGLSVPTAKLEIAQTMAFIVIIFAELFQVFTIRNNEKLLVQTGVGGNKVLWFSIFISIMLALVILLIPQLQALFGIILLPMEEIFKCVGLALIPVIAIETMKLLKIN